jgi:hypothetical protein
VAAGGRQVQDGAVGRGKFHDNCVKAVEGKTFLESLLIAKLFS